MNKRLAFFLTLISSVVLIYAQESSDVEVYSEQTGTNGFSFYADNPAIVPQFLVLEFPSLVNMQASVQLPVKVLLQPGAQRVPLVTLTAIRQATYSYRSSYSFVFGNPDAIHDPQVAYLLPFPHGSKYRLTQGNDGRFTHFSENRFAYDFDLKIGDPITAARGGLVVKVKEDSNVGGVGTQYNDAGNQIMIYHEDGSFGNYVHLKQNGAIVEVGDTVVPGQLIGYSGNTGRSSGPHLHFDVRIPTQDGKMYSIPISFLKYDGSIFKPTEGEFVYGFVPGKEPFPIELGILLTEDAFSQGPTAISETGKIEVRSEVLDETYVLFIQNGTSTSLEIAYTLTLQNYRSSRQNPGTITVPPKSEIFLTILQPIRPNQGGSYSINIRPVPRR